MTTWNSIDTQMNPWAPRLRDDLNINAADSYRLATVMAKEVNELPDRIKKEIKESSPVSINNRLDELIAFQDWMDTARTLLGHPAITRAQVITQNYICFIYLKDSCFYILDKNLPIDSSAKKCCSFLIGNPVKAFRNALAHANWQYKADYSGIEFWARDNPGDKGMTRWEVNQADLNFWQQLSRAVAYVTYVTLCEGN